jgi:hypothetical protein
MAYRVEIESSLSDSQVEGLRSRGYDVEELVHKELNPFDRYMLKSAADCLGITLKFSLISALAQHETVVDAQPTPERFEQLWEGWGSPLTDLIKKTGEHPPAAEEASDSFLNSQDKEGTSKD